MIIGGLQKTSLIDYPGHISAVLFTVGCNMRCPFCHNTSLIQPEAGMLMMNPDKILEFLEKRKKYLDAVVITGGEPTVHVDLPDLVAKIKKMGYKVKLDTNGTHPKMLQQLLDKELLDYVAIDLKAELEFEKYNKVSGAVLSNEMFDNIHESISIILNSKVDHEFRTTAIKGIHGRKDFNSIIGKIEGAKRFIIQRFNPETTHDPAWGSYKPFEDEELKEFLNIETPIDILVR